MMKKRARHVKNNSVIGNKFEWLKNKGAKNGRVIVTAGMAVLMAVTVIIASDIIDKKIDVGAPETSESSREEMPSESSSSKAEESSESQVENEGGSVPENEGSSEPEDERDNGKYIHLMGTKYPHLFGVNDEQKYFLPEPENQGSSSGGSASGGSSGSSGTKYPSGLRGYVQKYQDTVNSDTIGWIYIPNTQINYAVVQSTDNEYYLYRDYYKRYTDPKYYPPATIFADYEVISDVSTKMSWNTVLYGHNWYCHWEPARLEYPANSMFANLSSYRYSSFADTHRKIYYSTEYEDLTFEVFAVFSAYTSFVDKYLIYPNAGKAKREYVVEEALKRSEFDFGVEVSPDDKIITLITCSYRYTDDGTGRYIVMGRLSK